MCTFLTKNIYVKVGCALYTGQISSLSEAAQYTARYTPVPVKSRDARYT